MIPSILNAAVWASAVALLAAPAQAQSSSGPTATTAPKAITTLGCYSKPDPLTALGEYTFQTSGYCQTQCVGLGKTVMGITAGSTCYCGDELPALDVEVSESNCDTPCFGYDQENCGGINYWQIYLTGLSNDVNTAANSTSSTVAATSTSTTSSQGTTSTQPSVITKAGQTIIVTAAPTASQTAKSGGGGSSKVGIAVGVVVGVVGLAAITGGVILFMKRRRNQAIEEEHRRNAAISQFTSGAQSDKSSTTDQRLDPSIFSHGRQSIGSIADERDFSRRILQVGLRYRQLLRMETNTSFLSQVRNPDRDSKSSAMA